MAISCIDVPHMDATSSLLYALGTIRGGGVVNGIAPLDAGHRDVEVCVVRREDDLGGQKTRQ